MIRRPVCMALVWMCAASSLWGCASSGTKALVRESPFTEPETLAQITAKSAPEEVLDDDGLRVARWDMRGDLPDHVGISPIQSAGDRLEGALLDATSRSGDMVATEAMRCAARQMGEFALEHELLKPSEAIRDFIRHRCGAVASNLYSSHYTWDLEPGQTLTLDRLEESVFEGIADDIYKGYKDVGPIELGLWFGQKEGKAIVQVAAGRRYVDVERFTMKPFGTDRIAITGKVFTQVLRVRAMITQGEYGAEECVMDSSVKLPRFRAVCPVVAADERALFALYDRREDSIFSKQIFDQIVWPAGQIGDAYAESSLRQRLEQVNVAGMNREQAYLTYINAVRDDASVNPLVVNAPQTMAVKALTPHMFDAMRRGDEKDSSKIAMGLMAGWEIKAKVIDADFQVNSVSDGDPISLIESTLNSPSGRSTLLSKDGSAFAMGEVAEGDNIGAMMLVYEYLPDETYIRRLARGWRTINKARKLTGKKPIRRSKKSLKRSKEIARKMADGSMSYEKGLDALMSSVVASYNSNVMSYATLTHDLDDFDLPDEVMQAKSVEAVLMVTPLDVPDYPWTIYAVVVVIPTSRFKK